MKRQTRWGQAEHDYDFDGGPNAALGATANGGGRCSLKPTAPSVEPRNVWPSFDHKRLCDLADCLMQRERTEAFADFATWRGENNIFTFNPYGGGGTARKAV